MPAYLQNLSADTQTRTLQLLEALARHVGLLPPLALGPPPPPPVPTITKSIGTTGRDYSTITAWEADLDNGAIYASGDTALGECYDDSAFDESATINGGGTVGLASTVLSVAAGERHDGTAGTGARLVASVADRGLIFSGTAGITRRLEWFEYDGNSKVLSGIASPVQFQASSSHGGQQCRNVISHTFSRTIGSVVEGIRFTTTGTNAALNNFVYNISTGSATAVAAGIAAGSNTSCCNNTIHDINLGSGSSTGVGITGTATKTNNLATECDTSSFVSSTGQSYNASSDTTAAGTGSLASITTADQYVSTTVGSEDLHLKAGADCIDAGTDLVTTPTSVNIDIDGRDRDAMADTWDIGADEYVAVGGTGHAHSKVAVTRLHSKIGGGLAA